ncbi:MAG: MFS transporter [Nitrospirae bacterium]|nr:MFS transporter [Nitrospirota bacterium]
MHKDHELATPFFILCITGFLAIFSSTISKSPVLPLFATHLGAGPSGVGMVAAVSAFTGIIASIPAGMLSDRWGRKRMLVISSVVFGTAPFLYLFVTTIWQLAIVRFYHGFATALFIPVSMALISDMFSNKRGERLGWFSTSTLLGRFGAPIAGGTLLGVFAGDPDVSFRAVYLVCGAAGALTLLLSFRIPATHEKSRTQQSWTETLLAFRSVVSHRAILITALVEAAILFAYGTFETFIPLYAREHGISTYEIGIFLSSQVITLAITKPVMGRFSDRHGRRPQIIAGALLGALSIAAFSLASSFLPMLAFSILFGLSLSVVTSATSAYIADLSRKETHGSAMGLLGSVMDIGHTTGPLAAGIVASSFGYRISFVSASVVLILASSLFSVTMLNSRHETNP